MRDGAGALSTCFAHGRPAACYRFLHKLARAEPAQVALERGVFNALWRGLDAAEDAPAVGSKLATPKELAGILPCLCTWVCDTCKHM